MKTKIPTKSLINKFLKDRFFSELNRLNKNNRFLYKKLFNKKKLQTEERRENPGLLVQQNQQQKCYPAFVKERIYHDEIE